MSRAREIRLPLFDFSGGIVGNLSDYELRKPTFLVRANNLTGVPIRGLDVRAGSRELCSARLSTAPHSLTKWLSTSGSRKLFVGHGASISEMTASTITAQVLPLALLGGLLRFTQYNDVLFCCENGGVHRPIAFIGTGWAQTNLQAPAAATIAANAGGAVDVGQHFYRVRNRYLNGCSLATPTSPASLTIAGPNQTVSITGLPNAAPGGRTDWLGWVIERTMANDPLGANGIYYEVATGNTATYPAVGTPPAGDAAADSTLWNRVLDSWYTPPGNFNGMFSHYGRVIGWEGTFLYPSFEVGGNQYVGIFNFYPLAALRVGSDDGDIIVSATPQSGRYVVFKSRSMHFLEGDSLETFQVVDVPDSGGVSGPRACCTISGSTVIHFNDDGLWITRRSTPEPFGWNEIGHYFSEVNAARKDKVKLYNVGNRLFVMSYSAGSSQVNDHALVYDFATRRWDHYTDFYAEDVYVQEDQDFAGARVLSACGLDLDTSDFNCLSLLEGTADLRASDGTGGRAIQWGGELPYLDFGLPESWKHLKRLEVAVHGHGTRATVAVASGETGETFSHTFEAPSEGADWCEDVATHPNDLEWDVGEWAGDQDNALSTPTGIPVGMLGKRFGVKFSATGFVQGGLRGMVLRGTLRPEKRKNT